MKVVVTSKKRLKHRGVYYGQGDEIDVTPTEAKLFARITKPKRDKPAPQPPPKKEPSPEERDTLAETVRRHQYRRRDMKAED
jgi:hypothetical protein